MAYDLSLFGAWTLNLTRVFPSADLQLYGFFGGQGSFPPMTAHFQRSEPTVMLLDYEVDSNKDKVAERRTGTLFAQNVSAVLHT